MTSLPFRLALGASALIAAVLLVDACGGPPKATPPPARYELNEAALSDNADLALDADGRAGLERTLIEHFGTPDDPRYLVLAGWREQGFDPNHWTDEEGGAEPLEASPLSLAESAALFRARCARCHGLSGGGDGPMASRLRTPPRDYRHGVFKNTPLGNRARPRPEDLERTLVEGIEGTAMPSWGARLTGAEIAGLSDYVRLLAIRGETERMAIFDYDADDGLDLEAFREGYELTVERWREGGGALIVPGPPPEATPERVAHGDSLFHDLRGAACVRCHGSAGHGDGESATVVDPLTGELVPFRDEWGNPIRPRDLVCAPLRFGDSPEDLYRRIHAGINGTPMPAHEGLLVVEADGTQHELEEDDIWDLVFYVNTLRP